MTSQSIGSALHLALSIQASDSLAHLPVPAIVITVGVALIIGCGASVIANVAGTAIGGAVLRGFTAMGVVIGLASAHAGFDATPGIYLLNLLTGIGGGIGGSLLMRLDGLSWPASILRGGACFGGAVTVALAVELLLAAA